MMLPAFDQIQRCIQKMGGGRASNISLLTFQKSRGRQMSPLAPLKCSHELLKPNYNGAKEFMCMYVSLTIMELRRSCLCM